MSGIPGSRVCTQRNCSPSYLNVGEPDENLSGVPVAVQHLLATFSQLKFIQPHGAGDGKPLLRRVDLRPSVPHRRAKAFLSTLETVAEALKLPMVSRKYRQIFTRNYRSLMPCDTRLYRVDVLEAGQEGHAALWVNGEKYVLTTNVTTANEKFQQSWGSLLELLEKLLEEMGGVAGLQTPPSTSKPSDHRTYPTSPRQSNSFEQRNWLARLGPVLTSFDKSWTDFERHYINALIGIEKQSRRIVTECMHTDEELRQYESLYMRLLRKRSPPLKDNTQTQPSSCTRVMAGLQTAIRLGYIDLMTKISQLNNVANIHHTEGGTYRFALLEEAFRVLRVSGNCVSCGSQHSLPFSKTYEWLPVENHWTVQTQRYLLETLVPLVQPLVDELDALRDVLYRLSLNPDRVDPHLAQNAQLVKALSLFETRWRDAAPYLENPRRAQSLSQFLVFLSGIVDLDFQGYEMEASPAHTSSQDFFHDRIAACDVSAFLALPRLAVLFAISTALSDEGTAAATTTMHLECLQCLLPETFRNFTLASQIESHSFVDSSVPAIKVRSRYLDLFKLQTRLAEDSFWLTHQQAKESVAQTDVIAYVFGRVIHWGARIATLCSSEISGVVAVHILERCVKTLPHSGGRLELRTRIPHIPGLVDVVNNFLNALEECSIALQRTHPTEWNAFVETSMKCLQAIRPSSPVDQQSVKPTLQEQPPCLREQNGSEALSTLYPDEAEAESCTPPRCRQQQQQSSDAPSPMYPGQKINWLLEGSPAPLRTTIRQCESVCINSAVNHIIPHTTDEQQ